MGKESKTFFDFISSIFGERAGSSLYFSFIVAFITWNWALLFVLFFESSEIIGIPKIAYIAENLSINVDITGTNLTFLAGLNKETVSNVLSFLLTASYRIFPAVIITYVSVSYFPIFNKWALGKEVSFKTERKLIKEDAENDYLKRSLEMTRERTETLKTLEAARLEETSIIKNLRETQPQLRYSPKDGLTPNQVESILALLTSFGADKETIKGVERALYKG